MRQIMPGRCDSSKQRSYKVPIGKNTSENMQSIDHCRALKKPKRLRSAFTTDQINYLEKAFKRFPYIDRETRQHLASVLKIGERPIKIWFQNRRMKEKKENFNHKEFDVEMQPNDLQFGQHQLNNVPTLQSTNEDRSYSLPTLSAIADSTVHTNTMKVNKTEFKNKVTTHADNKTITLNTELNNIPIKANFYREIETTNSDIQRSSYFDKQPKVDTKLPYTTETKKKIPSKESNSTKPVEISINLCKKYKEERVSPESGVTGNVVKEEQKKTPEKQLAPKKEPDNVKKSMQENFDKNVGVSGHLPPPLKPPTHVDMNKPVYFPVMPSVYPQPLMGSDGVLWKPVNFMSLMTSNGPPILGNQAPIQAIKNCTCNCHSSPHVPVNFSPLQNPYTQYVISVPFPHTSPNF